MPQLSVETRFFRKKYLYQLYSVCLTFCLRRKTNFRITTLKPLIDFIVNKIRF